MPDTHDCSYLAGLIDGDGCFKCSGRKYKGEQYYYPHLEVGAVSRGHLEILQSKFGGNISNGSTPQGKSFHHWRIGTKLLRELLPKVRPYLILKGDQADIVQQMLDMERTPYGQHGTSSRAELAAQLKHLKTVERDWDPNARYT